MTDENLAPQLHMLRQDLDDLPAIELPAGYLLRSYRPGDHEHWSRIIGTSYGGGTERFSFDRIMRADPAFRPERIFLVCCGGEPVATASANYDPTFMRDAGVVHYLGVLPEHQGRRLGYWVTLAALCRMRDEGRTRARLTTDDFRLPAIRTYLNLGLEPLLVHENQRERWPRVFRSLEMPELCEKYAHILKGPIYSRPDYPPDQFDYNARVRKQGRWHPHRACGRPHRDDVDARADESLYRPSALGTAGASIADAIAGEDKPLELWFRAGLAGIAAGTEVRYHVAGQRPLGTVAQANDPSQPGFVEIVSAPDDVAVELVNVGFRLVSGSLREGQEIRIAVGRRGGFTWTPLAGRKEFKVIIDVGAGEPSMRLPEPVVVRVLPGDADHLDLFLPGTAGRGSLVSAAVTVRDRYDNRVPFSGRIEVRSGDTAAPAYLADGVGRAMLPGPAKAPVQAEAVLEGIDGASRSNPCAPAGQYHLYFGDMHCHDHTCEAEGHTADAYRWALEDKRLDFLSVAAQCHNWIDNDKWALLRHLAEAYLDEGRFVTFLAFEWQHSHYGDKVIHYLGNDMPYLPVDDPRYAHPSKLYEALRGADAFIISHHPGYALDQHVPGTDWDAVETDVDRLVELWSMHGSSEGYSPDDRPLRVPRREEGVMAGLRKGLRMGFVAGSDTHTARPGGSAKEPCRYWGGLCGVWAKELTRRSLFEAFLARRTYALTDARIILDFRVNGACMGSEIAAFRDCTLTVEVHAPRPVSKVELLRDGLLMHSQAPGADSCRVEHGDRRDNDAPVFYHCRVTLDDGNLAVCSPVWVG